MTSWLQVVYPSTVLHLRLNVSCIFTRYKIDRLVTSLCLCVRCDSSEKNHSNVIQIFFQMLQLLLQIYFIQLCGFYHEKSRRD